MQSWKKLEVFVAEYLGWKRLTKKHYGDSKPDVEGDGFKGDAKHYKAHKIHTIKNVTDAKYHDDVIIFTKVKRTHYLPSNVLVTLSLEQFNALLKDKRIIDEMINVHTDDSVLIDNKLTNNLKTLMYKLETILLASKNMKKIIKEMKKK